MTVKLLNEQHLEFLSLIEGCTGSYESTHVKMPHCWKSYVAAHILSLFLLVVTFTMHNHLLYPSVTHILFHMKEILPVL